MFTVIIINYAFFHEVSGQIIWIHKIQKTVLIGYNKYCAAYTVALV